MNSFKRDDTTNEIFPELGGISLQYIYIYFLVIVMTPIYLEC